MLRVPRLTGHVRRVHPRRVDGDVRTRREAGGSTARRFARSCCLRPAVKGHHAACALLAHVRTARTSYARIEFRLGKPGALDAWIVEPDGKVVKQIAHFRDVRRVALRWNGRQSRADACHDGSYRLPSGLRVDTDASGVRHRRTTPPSSTRRLRRERLTLNGDGVDDHAVVTWRSPVQLFGVRLVATSDGRTQTVPSSATARLLVPVARGLVQRRGRLPRQVQAG